MFARLFPVVTVCLAAQIALMGSSRATESDTYHLTSIPVGSNPFAVAVDQHTNMAYVIVEDAIDVIDETTDQQVATIDMPGAFSLAVDDVTHTLLVASHDSQNFPFISKVDASTGAVLGTEQLPYVPFDLAVDARTHRVFGTSAAGLIVLNETNLAVKDVISLQRLGAIAVDSRRKTVWVTSGAAGRSDPGTVNSVDEKTDTVTASLTVGLTPFGVAIDPTRNILLVANQGVRGSSYRAPSTVSVVNATSGTVTAIPTNHGVSSVAVDPSRGIGYVTEDFTPGHVLVVNGRTGSLVTKLAVGGEPESVAVDPSLHTAYVTSARKNALEVISRS